MENYLDIANQFEIGSRIISFAPFGNGHINTTILITTESGKKYILQRINTSVFKDVNSLVNNVFIITEFLKSKGFESLHTIKTKDGQLYLRDNGSCYRIYDYIDDTVCYEKVDNIFLIYSNGKAFGKLHRALKEFDASKLKETIPNFHSTSKRYQNLLDAINENKYDRVKTCADEILYLQSKKDDYSVIEDGIASKEIAHAVTHNDPKINNILFDKFSGEIRAVIDLDTIMPGSYLYDFGDAIRSLLTGDNEDTNDLNKLSVNPEVFEAYAKGYLSEMSSTLTQKEIALLPFSVYLLSIELAIRFLEDYIRGDVYFKTKYPTHNLVRAKTQITLADNVLKSLDELNAIVRKIMKNKTK